MVKQLRPEPTAVCPERTLRLVSAELRGHILPRGWSDPGPRVFPRAWGRAVDVTQAGVASSTVNVGAGQAPCVVLRWEGPACGHMGSEEAWARSGWPQPGSGALLRMDAASRSDSGNRFLVSVCGGIDQTQWHGFWQQSGVSSSRVMAA